MKNYQRKIKAYNQQVIANYMNKTKLEQTIENCKSMISLKQERKLNYLEFIYQQSLYIKKSWWFLQIAVLLVGWFILKDTSSQREIQRILAIIAPLFVTLIVPEIWRNRRYYAIEIENSSFYSLSQVYSARIIIFGLVDLFLLTIFFLSSNVPLQVFMINFVIPFNVCCCICFQIVINYKYDFGVAVLRFVIWTVAWLYVLSNEELYQLLVMPIWLGLFILSCIYLGYSIYQIQKMEVEGLWN